MSTVTLAGINDLLIRLFFRDNASSEVASGLAGSDGLYLFIWWVGVFFFVLLMGLMFWFCWKYRRRPGVAPERSSSHNTALEITWSVVPTLILVVIFFWGFDGYLRSQMPAGHAEQIDTTALMWNWEMTYDNGGFSAETVTMGNKDAPVFYVPAGQPVQLRMSSKDVIHSFWVPDFRTKLDVMPNRYTPYQFTTEPLASGDPRVKTMDITKGELVLKDAQYRDHWIFCAEYCGDSHSEMVGVLRVVEPSVFKTWKETPAYGVIDPPDEVGEIVYKAKGCAVCHSVDGSNNTGPTWLNAYGKPVRFADGTELSQADLDADPFAWDNYIRESIILPHVKIHEGYANAMASYDGRLSDVEMRGLIAYIRSLSDTKPDTDEIPLYDFLNEQTEGEEVGGDTAEETADEPAPAAEGEG
ncbi:MAG: cytochrome c oxidase subunit II [Planctomycetota bacterium]